MASINKVILIGNLGKDPEVKYLPSGEAVAALNIATTEKWKDKTGAQQEHTEWHRAVFFGRQAEVCGEWLKKGSSVYIEGSLKTRKYTDKQGVERVVTEIGGAKMQMLGGRGDSAPSPKDAPARKAAAKAEEPVETTQALLDMDDDIPF